MIRLTSNFETDLWIKIVQSYIQNGAEPASIEADKIIEAYRVRTPQVFKVLLKGFGHNCRSNTINTIRMLTGLDLTTAKKLTDEPLPKVLVSCATQAQASEWNQMMTEAGATISIQPLHENNP